MIVNGVVFFTLGIKVANDSPRYLDYADKILNEGFFFDPHEFWYIGYVGFIMFFKLLALPLSWVVFTQYSLGLLAMIAIYFTMINLFENRPAAFTAALLFICFFELSLFNAYILGEANLISLITISFLFLSLWYKGKANPINLTLGILIILLATLTKPTGVSILAAILVYVIFKINQRIHGKSKKVAFMFILIVPFIFLINKMLTPFGFMNDYSRGELIFGMFQYPDNPNYDLLTIDRPDQLYFPDESYPAIVRLSLFIIQHPIYWIKLFLGKITLLFLHIRPFWSTWHNVFSLAFLLPVYYFFIAGFRSASLKIELKVFAITYILLHALSVGMLTDDWDGRFLLPVLPLIFLIASLKIGEQLMKKKVVIY